MTVGLKVCRQGYMVSNVVETNWLLCTNIGPPADIAAGNIAAGNIHGQAPESIG